MFEPDNEQLQAVIMSQDMIEAIAELRFAINHNVALGVEIDPLKIYCQKTGHIIGARDENSLFNTIKFHGKNEILKSLYQATSLSIHPAWLYTNGERLDVLINADPIGYACYCFGLITAQFYQNAKNTDRKRQPWIERYWAMARANAILTQRGIGELTELNVALCQFLTYSSEHSGKNNPKSYLLKRIGELGQTPDTLAALAVTGELAPMLKTCINKALAAINYVETYVHNTRFIDKATTPADAARGPSNIRQQKASKRDVKEAGMFAELRKLFDDSGLQGMGIFTNKQTHMTGNVGALKNRIADANEDSEEKMLQDLYNLGGTNLDGMFQEQEDENANEVEVNMLAVLHQNLETETKAFEEPKTQQQIPQEQMQQIALQIEHGIMKSNISSVQNIPKAAQSLRDRIAARRSEK